MSGSATKCGRCGLQLQEYRGAWFSAGDTVCCASGEVHAPKLEPIPNRGGAGRKARGK